jgi:hypothetical protein
MAVGGMGTQYLMLPVLGVGGFGVYRALSNLAGPARLLVVPMQPVLKRVGVGALTSLRYAVGVAAAAVFLGAATALLLLGLQQSDLAAGVLADMSQHNVIGGIFVAGVLLTSFWSVVARVRVDSRLVLRTRLVQTVVVGLAPLIAALVSGLMWGLSAYAGAYLAVGLLWLVRTRQALNA